MKESLWHQPGIHKNPHIKKQSYDYLDLPPWFYWGRNTINVRAEMYNMETWMTIYISIWTMELDMMMDQAENPNTEEVYQFKGGLYGMHSKKPYQK